MDGWIDGWLVGWLVGWFVRSAIVVQLDAGTVQFTDSGSGGGSRGGNADAGATAKSSFRGACSIDRRYCGFCHRVVSLSDAYLLKHSLVYATYFLPNARTRA